MHRPILILVLLGCLVAVSSATETGDGMPGDGWGCHLAALLGGGGDETVSGMAVDGTGYIYLTGQTSSWNFPVYNALQPSHAGFWDAYVVKLAPDRSIVFATYLGGSRNENGGAIAVDKEGRIWVTGSTESTDFPGAGGSMLAANGTSDAFLVAFAPDGSVLEYAGLLGGEGTDTGSELVISEQGIYISGKTKSLQFPLRNASQLVCGGGWDAFLLHLAPGGESVTYATYYGGSEDDFVEDMVVSDTGNVSLAGTTYSSKSGDLPVKNPFQGPHAATYDGFVAGFDRYGALRFGTYLGGGWGDRITSIAEDHDGALLLGGYTYSSDFPLVAAANATFHGGQESEGFAALLTADGSALVFSTCIGGSRGDFVQDIAAGRKKGTVILTGGTLSPDFPCTDPALPRGAGQEVFVAVLDVSGTAIRYAAGFGGDFDESGIVVAPAPDGTVYVGGTTISPLFPQVFGKEDVTNGGSDIVLLALAPSPGQSRSHPQTPLSPVTTVAGAAGILVWQWSKGVERRGRRSGTRRPHGPTLSRDGSTQVKFY